MSKRVARNNNEVGRLKSGSDVITSLPSELTQRILQFLPLRDAARTSVLSSSWRYKWLSLPDFRIDYNKLLPMSLQNDRCQGAVDVSSIISNILLRHIGPIHKFDLYIPCGLVVDTNICSWLQFVSCQGVKEFTLFFQVGFGNNEKVPSCLFSCVGFNHLTHLTLVNCSTLSVPTTFKGFPCLVSLILSHWTNSSNLEKLESLISSCPQLQNLYLGVSVNNTLTIYAPKLKDLALSGRIPNICLVGDPNIKSLRINISVISQRNMVTFFGCVPSIEKLIFNGWGLEHWFKEEDFSIKFEFLRTVIMEYVPLDSQLGISFLVKLLQGSPYLQKLKIRADNCEECDILLKDLRFGHLRHVQLVFYEDLLSALHLIKFLLRSSPVLEIMIVDVTRVNEEAEQVKIMVNELLQYRRASMNAEIIWKT